MILRQNNDSFDIKSQYSFEYYRNYILFILSFFLIIHILMFYLLIPAVFKGNANAIAFSLIIMFLLYLIFPHLKKSYKQNKIRALRIENEKIWIQYIVNTTSLEETILLKDDIKIKFEIEYAKVSIYVITFIRSDGSEYRLPSEHGLWWSEDVEKIFKLIKEKKYKVRKNDPRNVAKLFLFSNN